MKDLNKVSEIVESSNFWENFAALGAGAISFISYKSFKYYAHETGAWIGLIMTILSSLWVLHRMIIWYRAKGWFSIFSYFKNKLNSDKKDGDV